MDGEYIEAVRQAYERYFQELEDIPTLFVDTNSLNFVTNPSDLQSILDRISSAIKAGTFQQTLPQLELPAPREPLRHGRQLADYQRFHSELDKTKGFHTDVYFNYLCLSEEMGELGSELAKLWRAQEALVAQGKDAGQARTQALTEHRSSIESELADCMAYLLKLANYTGVDLETAYLDKMKENQSRVWSEPQ
jgi:NTP pyrophosphatase (non-canonical NTP hydrolase)